MAPEHVSGGLPPCGSAHCLHIAPNYNSALKHASSRQNGLARIHLGRPGVCRVKLVTITCSAIAMTFTPKPKVPRYCSCGVSEERRATLGLGPMKPFEESTGWRLTLPYHRFEVGKSAECCRI